MRSLDGLRRFPDVEGPGLVAVDAADRLLLDESREARAEHPSGIVVIGDTYGALTLGSALEAATSIRVHQDALNGERALAANASERGLEGSFRSLPLDRSLVAGARVVLVRLPRSLDALRDYAALIAACADPDVCVFAGGRIKHMTTAMNGVLRAHFGRVDVTHARQKSRVLVARQPEAGQHVQPRCLDDAGTGLTVCALGGVFAGERVDHGTRLLLDHLPDSLPGGTRDDPLIDLACGSGVVASWLATRHPDAHVLACDQSAAAVRSADASAEANGVRARVTVTRDDALSARPDASASLVALNPPFHSGAALTTALAEHLFSDAARVLRPGGQLWCVWNSPQSYRPLLQRIVGPTRQVARDARFTVTVSTKR